MMQDNACNSITNNKKKNGIKLLDTKISLLFHIHTPKVRPTNPIIKHRSSSSHDKHKHQIISTYGGPYHFIIHGHRSHQQYLTKHIQSLTRLQSPSVKKRNEKAKLSFSRG